MRYTKNMTTATMQKLKKEIKQEVMQELTALLLKNSRDAEGEYKESFVKKVLKAAQEKPVYQYDAKTFLKLLS